MDDKELRIFSLRSAMIFLYIVVVAVIPLALRARIVSFTSPVETWRRLESKTITEVFAQFRLELLIIATVLIVITALLKYYYEDEKDKLASSYADYPLLVFAALVILSSLLSPYINLAFWGFYNRGEGAFAYLSYIFIFIVAANFINAEKDKKIIFYVALAAGLLQSLLAVTQFFGFDVLKSELAMRLFVPSRYLPYVEDIEFMFRNKGAGATINPNYMGGYMAMIFPMIFVRYLYSRTARETAIWMAALIIGLTGFFAPTSMAAFIAGGIAIIFFLVISRKDAGKYNKKLIATIVILIVIIGISEPLTGGAIGRKISGFYRNSFVLIRERMDEGVTLRQDFSGDVAAGGSEGKEIVIYRNPLDTFASNRGYIWRKSLEMMKDNLLIGSGLDTFVYNFPHWDPHRDHSVYRIGLLIDKPHNTYIQIATGVGVLGLFVYLFVLGRHLFYYLRIYRLRGVKEESDLIMLALFIGWVGYLIQGLSNDSVLSNAPVFWALFGISVNYVKNAMIIEKDVIRKKPGGKINLDERLKPPPEEKTKGQKGTKKKKKK
ncbi:MAG: O-antigen ligase family protein [Dethiobacteria bacterium]